ncbi:MAG: sensor domain-containing diguanylate cyclase [bacterium]|nr:sensor domain-containing diguanylate cyclase [bacterium]
MTKLFIIGGGVGGAALLPILHDDKEIEVVGIADTRNDAPGLVKARELGIAISNDYAEFLSKVRTDVIVNVTGNNDVSRDIHSIKKEGVEVLEGLSAKLLFNLVDERKKREEEISKSLRAQQMLYDIGIMLTSSDREEDMLSTIIQYAMKLTNTPAGSIALYNEALGQMELVASHGFSSKFSKHTKWKIQKGGVSDHILNNGNTVSISDISDQIEIERPNIESEGIKSLLATPLIAERKTIGILYVDDFKKREFSKKDESIIALLATQAAAAIEKLQILEKTRRLAITDELTSLYNHRHFVNLLQEELKRAKRYKRSLSIMLIDIDHFKHYNDTNGHLKGNDALKECSIVMLETIRNLDILARYGGEEFAVILPEADKREVEKCAERMRAAIEKRAFCNESAQPLGKLTISIGYATFPDDAKVERSLINRADIALYKAKDKGRNRVVAYAK